MSTDDALEFLDRFGGHHELVLQEAGRPVGAVPLTEHVERVIELRQVLDLAAVGARLQVPQLADRHERVLVGQPVGEDVGQCEQLRRIEFQWVTSQFRGQLVQLGQRTARDRGAAQFRRLADRVEPRAGVRVVGFTAVAVECDGFVETLGDVAVGDEVRRFGGRHLDGGTQDDAGKPVAADRRPEQFGVVAPPGVRCRTCPSAVSSSIDRTWLPKLPALWWFLPWISHAIAPPMVTWRVPGSTGTHSPNGSAAFISWSRLTPPSTSTRSAVAGRMSGSVFSAGHVDHQAAAVLGVVAVGAAEAAGDHATAESARASPPRRRSPRYRGSTARGRRWARFGPSPSAACGGRTSCRTS